MAAPCVQDVLGFLTAHGFARAASALRDDLLARGELDETPPPLPPVRTAPPPPRRDDGAAAGSSPSSSSSSAAFVSMGSSPSELLNPYGLWSPPGVKSQDSSDRNSEFGTAREYSDFNIFSDTCWYDDRYPGYLGDPYLAPANAGDCRSEDKFVMSVEAEELIMKQDGKNSGTDAKAERGASFSSSFPLCDCCSGEASDRVGNSNSSVYGCYRIMPDETEIMDECGEDGCQLKRVDELPEVIRLKSDSLLDPNQERERKCLELRLAEKEFWMLNTNAVEEITSTSNGELQKEDCNMQLVAEKASQPDADEGNELGECGAVDIESQDPGALGFEGEDHGIIDELQLYNSHEDEFEIFDLRIIHRKNRTGFEENKDLPIVLNSVIAGRYYVTEYLGSAAFSKVVQAHDLHTGINVCLKIIKNDKDFFDQSLDEIKLLKFVNKYDPADERHILRLYDYFYHQEHLFIVCELLRANLYEFQNYNQDSGGEVYFTLPRIQVIARQCLEALEYLHDLRIIHCDLKPENILIKNYSRCEIKIIDLGSSCFRTDNLSLYVQSRSYRAPEVILGLPYDPKIDIWSLGCVLAELYTGDVLFANDSLVMMLARMIGMLGPIDMEMLEMGQETHKYFTDDYDLYHRNEETDQVEYLIPEKSSLAHHLQVSDTAFIDFLNCLLQINPKRRPTACQALQHRWLSISYK